MRWGDECERMNASRRIPERMRTNLPQTVSFSERRRQIIVTIKGATTCSPLHSSQRAKPSVTTCTRNTLGEKLSERCADLNCFCARLNKRPLSPPMMVERTVNHLEKLASELAFEYAFIRQKM